MDKITKQVKELAASLNILILMGTSVAMADAPKLRLPCGEAPSRVCMVGIVDKLKGAPSKPWMWLRAVVALAVADQTKAARALAERRLAGKPKSDALLIVAGIAAARAGKVADAKSAASKLKEKFNILDIALELWKAGKAAAADEIVAAKKDKNLANMFLLEKAKHLALTGKSAAAMEVFRKHIATLDPSLREEPEDIYWQFIYRIRTADRPKIYPMIAKTVPDNAAQFDFVIALMVRDLIVIGAKKEVNAILDEVRIAWFGRPPASQLRKGVKDSYVDTMAYLYARMGNLAAIKHMQKGMAPKNVVSLAPAFARAGDVATAERLIAAEKSAGFRLYLQSLIVPELMRAGKKAAAQRIAKAFATGAGAPGKNRRLLGDWANIASAASQPMAIFRFAKSEADKSNLLQPLAQQFARSSAYRKMIELLRAPQIATLSISKFEFGNAALVCRLARQAALSGKHAQARELAYTWYRARAARGGVRRRPYGIEISDCQSNGGDHVGALEALTSDNMAKPTQIAGLIYVMEQLPR